MKNFEKLKIWEKGMEIARLVYELIGGFPKEERFGISIQMTRAAVSIPSNIAEGSSRSSEKDYSRYIEIALGSCYELQTQLLIAKSVNYGNAIFLKKILAELDEEQRMLSAFLGKLRYARPPTHRVGGHSSS